MNEKLQDKLVDLFILKDFMARNKYLPINPRQVALEEYWNDSLTQQRVDGIVRDIMEVVEKYVTSIHSEKD